MTTRDGGEAVEKGGLYPPPATILLDPATSECETILTLGSMTFDPAARVQSLCFRASADDSYVNWFSSAVAAGVPGGVRCLEVEPPWR